MKLSPEQFTRLNTDGYVIIDCPFPRALTDACLEAVDKVVVGHGELSADAKKNHYSLSPQIPDSYWCTLDHSLPFLRIELHPEIVELGRQLLKTRPSVRVLLVTGHAEDDVSLPGAGLLCKPFRQEELSWALEALLSGKPDRT